jgi:WD40 repeat protein
VTFAPDGLTLATGSFDGTVKLWPREVLRPIQKKRDRGAVGAATGSFDGTVRLWPREVRPVQKRREKASVEGDTTPQRRLSAYAEPDEAALCELRSWLNGAVLSECGLSLSGQAVDAILGVWPSDAGTDCFDALLTAVSPEGRRLRLEAVGGLWCAEESGESRSFPAQVTARGEIRFVGLRLGRTHRLRFQ